MGHIRNNDNTGKLLNELEYVQLTSRMQNPILNKSTKNTFLKWTLACQITNFKHILNHIDGETKKEISGNPCYEEKR